MCLSLRCSTSAIKFTMNNTYIHLISLISASSGKQKMHFHPYGASKSSDLSHGQAPVGRRNHCFRRPASPHEIGIRLKLTAVRSLHKVCLKNTCFHRWKKKKKGRNIYEIFCSISWHGNLHSYHQWKFSTLPPRDTTLFMNHKTRREKNNVIASRSGSGHHLKNHHHIIRSGDRAKAGSKCDKLSQSKALRNSSETSLVIQVHVREWIN